MVKLLCAALVLSVKATVGVRRVAWARVFGGIIAKGV
jgi:hypothetical protein